MKVMYTCIEFFFVKLPLDLKRLKLLQSGPIMYIKLTFLYIIKRHFCCGMVTAFWVYRRNCVESSYEGVMERHPLPSLTSGLGLFFWI